MKLLRIPLLFALLIFPLSAWATSGERITNFDANISISKGNAATVTESIDYDFGAVARHGIFRFVPAQYTDDAGNRYFTTVQFLSVSRDGNNEPFTTSRSNGSEQAKIGDANRTISGLHRYAVTYSITPLINHKNGQDYLALDITGNGWEVPIEKVSATVRYEGDVQPSRSQCFSGTIGSTDQRGCTAENNTFGTTRQLAPGEGLTVEQFLPAGSFAAYLEPNARPPFKWTSLIPFVGAAAGGLLILAALARLLSRLWTERRRKKRQTIVPEYEAPDELTPAQVGLLTDSRTGMPEITATLIDLAVRGFVRIDQLEPKGFLVKSRRYQLTKLMSYDALGDYEKTLLAAIFAGGDVVELSQLDKLKMQSAISTVRASLQKSLETKQWYGDAPDPTLVAKSWYKSYLFRGLLVLALVCVVVAVIARPANLVVNIAPVIGGVIAYWLASRVGRLTNAGAKEWSRVEGFKWYLSMVEKDRLKFTDAPDKNPERFSKLLPFAIALGVEKEWAKQFEGIDVSKNTGWYGSYNGGFILPYALATDLSGGFAGTMQANSTVASNGGGGSSGGGFGGGGGGSW